MRLRLAGLSWGLSISVALLAFIAWGQGVRWHLLDLTTYQIFPVFGLVAFSLMWSMYVVGALARHVHTETADLEKYYRFVPIAILIAILLHPSLLVWQLARDGFGLPPKSYVDFVGPDLKWAVIVSSTAWLIFLAYEFRHKYRSRRWWKYFEFLADVALVGIFFHGLALGGQLQNGWFKYVWFFYGVVLLLVLVDLYAEKLGFSKKSASKL